MTIMKDKTSKSIRICCYVALFFCFIWAVSSSINLIANLFGDDASSIDWTKNTVLKVVILICYLSGIVAMIWLCIKAVLNTFKGLRENTVFPKSNVKLMFWIALADFAYLLGFWNLQILWDDNLTLTLSDTIFITPFFLLFFAFMYKVAADAVEENNLTI